MSIREIPKAFEYTCDKCGATHKQENASGHYGNSTPPGWLTIRLVRFNKHSEEFLICESCEPAIAQALMMSPKHEAAP